MKQLLGSLMYACITYAKANKIYNGQIKNKYNGNISLSFSTAISLKKKKKMSFFIAFIVTEK